MRRSHSISNKLTIGMSVIIVPIIGLLICYNNYSIRVVHNQVSEPYKNMVSMYMEEVDKQLDSVARYMSNLEASNWDLQIMFSTADEDEYTMAKIRLQNKITSDILLYEPVNSIFFYSTEQNDYMEVDNVALSYTNPSEVKSYLMDKFHALNSNKEEIRKSWYADKTGGKYYLFRILKVNDCYFGTWIDVGNLLTSLKKIDLGPEGTTLFATDSGKPMTDRISSAIGQVDLKKSFQNYYISGGETKYLVVGEHSEAGNFSLVALVPEKKILEKIPYLRMISYLLTICLIGIIPACILFLRKVVIMPLGRLVSAMHKIQAGNLETRIQPFRTSEEFKIVNETFNSMASQIRELKISAYEEKISRQKAELQYLQLQLNPHFFLNTLNIIFLLARAKKYDIIQELSQSLIGYFRFMFISNMKFIPLKDEIRHVENYIRIQELRLEKKFSCQFDLPDFLREMPIPPLLIHTFVENSFKYAMSVDNTIGLKIRI